MRTAELVAKVKANESPAVWLMATTICRVARQISRNQSRWSSRLGYALERLDQAREARREARAERRAATDSGKLNGDAATAFRQGQRLEREEDWSAAATAYQRVVELAPEYAPAWYRLGRCLHQLGDSAALEAVAAACRINDRNPHWLTLLADLLEQNGKPAEALSARRRAAELGAAEHPRWAVRLADLLDRVGLWQEARQVLQDNLARHPRHPLSHRRLGEISLKVGTWAGSLIDTVPDRAAARFQSVSPTEVIRAGRQALEQAAALEPAKTVWREALAEARALDGDLPGAITLYEAALQDAEQSTGRWVLAVKQRWQFRLESLHHRLGRPRVTDPLFACRTEPGEPVPEDAPAPGLFQAQWGYAGLTISGLVTAADVTHVEILLNGVLLRSLRLDGENYLPEFELLIRRATMAYFPPEATLEVRIPDGPRLRSAGGSDRLRLVVPHGDGSILDNLKAGGKLDKKGVISPSPEETWARQQRYLEIYAKVRDFFEQELGRPLFLMYGTLLGYYRQGDFIPGDDDFDCGYVSNETDPIAVKEETKQLIIKLLRAGFTISFNRRGRLFRIQLEREANDGFHLDVRPLWFQDGRVWLHNHCSFEATREDFLPVVEGELRGVRVLVPRDTEKFLRNHYGPNWRVPDPGFQYYLSEIDPAILENLSRALITVREYKELAERVRREVGEAPPAGRLVSVGSQDLYPLSQFIA